ncbi:MAG: ABC transporter permease [Pseudomonadota bacterium]
MADSSFYDSEKDTVRQSFWVATVAFVTLVYSLVVRDLRTEHKNAAAGILISIGQPLVAGLVFYAFISLMGGSAGAVRGDNLTFVLIGFIIFFMHIRTVSAVSGSLRPDMMNHARMTPFLMVCVKAISSAYKNILALIIMLILNFVLRDVWEMQDPLTFVIVVFFCWFSGVAMGIIFLAAIRYFTWGGLIQTTYIRICFFTSGKFFVANTVPSGIRPFMDWNPVFHLLDIGRDAAFLNYTARTTDLSYAIYVSLAVFVVAMLVEAHVRRHYSASHMPGG